MDASVREGRRFTLKGLWDAMPMTFFFQVVGCTIDKAEAESLCDEDKRMGERLQLSIITNEALVRLLKMCLAAAADVASSSWHPLNLKCLCLSVECEAVGQVLYAAFWEAS